MIIQDLDPEPDKLFKSFGVLWHTAYDRHGHEHPTGALQCIVEGCRYMLEAKGDNIFYCESCSREYKLPFEHQKTRNIVQRKLDGYNSLHKEVISLDLPPTKVTSRNEDDNYWVEARIGEKNGKRQAVVYFGEKVETQSKTDYSQLFIDFEDAQVRFDKGNKNPLKILASLTAEFPDSIVEIKKK